MTSPQLSDLSSSTNSFHYTTGAAVPPGSQTLLGQPPGALPQLQGRNIPPDLIHQYFNTPAQPYNSEQHTPAKPPINTCDKSSIQDIYERLQSLNSSISDAVNAFMENGLKTRVIQLRSSKESLSPLARMAVEQCGGTKSKNQQEFRNRFQNAILYDLITGFVYEYVEGERMEKISPDYEKFRMDITKVRNNEAFPEAQNWTRIAAKLLVAPSNQTWDEFADDLMEEMDSQFWEIGGTKPNAQRRKTINRDTGKLHLPAIIKTAFELSMEMHLGILSQRLKLTAGVNGSLVDPSEVEMGEDFAEKTSVQPGTGCRDYYIVGTRSFGLTAEFNDGTRKVYLKPMVDYCRRFMPACSIS